jgi:hypothetical protein
MVIPEINTATKNIMLADQTYLSNTGYIDIVQADFFNEILSRIMTNKNIFSDLDYDGTTFYNNMRLPASQFIIGLNKYPDGVTSKFTMEFAHCMRHKKYVQDYNDFQRWTMGHLHSQHNFKVIEGHYIDYTGIGSMATAILLVKKLLPGEIKNAMPTLNYYTYFKKNNKTFSSLRAEIKRHSNYL